MITDDLDELFCFYLIVLEGGDMKEPLWFENHEVELVAPLHVDSQADEGSLR